MSSGAILALAEAKRPIVPQLPWGTVLEYYGQWWLHKGSNLGPLPCESRRIIATASCNWKGQAASLVRISSRDYRRHPTNELGQQDDPLRVFSHRRHAACLRGIKDTTAALARSSKAVAMYFA
jgi:hypothetical protein